MKAILTGASTGIGKAILERFNAAGITTIVLGLHEPAFEFMGEFYQLDLSNVELVESSVNPIIERHSDAKILVNNAGLGVFDDIEKISLDDWQRVLFLNVTTPFILTRALVPKMKSRNFGRIVNVSSDADERFFAGATAYCASKHALKGLAGALREELIGTHISVTNISPGRVDTNFNGKSPGDRPDSLSPEDVAEQVMQVVSTSDRCVVEEIRLKSSLE